MCYRIKGKQYVTSFPHQNLKVSYQQQHWHRAIPSCEKHVGRNPQGFFLLNNLHYRRPAP